MKLRDEGRARSLRRRDARRAARVDRQGRGPRALQGRDGEDRPHVPARRRRPLGRGGARRRPRARASRPSCGPASRSGGIGRRHRLLGEASSTRRCAWALAQSPTHEVLIEESVLGWKEFELEVMRDRADNFIVVCSIENIDPMGVHTGDSITVAPAMTLTDREYQRLRDAARAVMTEIGVETGGANVQFAVDPKTGAFHVIEMNPRVSRSSALASKATGYPIAKIAAKLAVGYTLDELKNDITRTSRRVRARHRLRRRQVAPLRVREVPRRRRDPRDADEERRRGDEHRADVLRGPAEGGALARDGEGRPRVAPRPASTTALLAEPKRQRDLAMEAPEVELPEDAAAADAAARRGVRSRSSSRRRAPTASSTSWTRCAWGSRDEELFGLTAIDPGSSRRCGASSPPRSALKRGELGPIRAARRTSASASATDRLRRSRGGCRGRRAGDCACRRGRAPVYARVDTCAAEFVAHTPYLYSTYETESEAAPDATGAQGRHPRRRPEPDRPGDRVRLLLRARRDGAARARVRDRDGQLQPGDGVDRLRHVRPPVLRAAHARGRARHRATRRSPRGSSSSSAGRRRSSSRCRSRSAACACSARRADAIDRAEDRGRFDELLTKLALKRPRSGIAHVGRRGGDASPRTSASRCSCARATCSAGAR